MPLLTDAGLPPAKAAATLGLFGLATMTGRLLAGYLVDRFFAAHVASVLIGPGARRLTALEEVTKRRFVIEGRSDVPHDHLEVNSFNSSTEYR